jgi:hypothetical protein
MNKTSKNSKSKSKTNKPMYKESHVFPFTLEGMRSLNCHQHDCVNNVFTALKLLNRNEGLQMANVTGAILNDRIIEILIHKFGVHFLYTLLYDNDSTNPNYSAGTTLQILNSELTDNNSAIIVSIRRNANAGHLALIARLNDILYYVDPQTNNVQELNIESFKRLVISLTIDKLFVIVSGGKSTLNQNITHFEKKLKFNKTISELKKPLLKSHIKGDIYNFNINNHGDNIPIGFGIFNKLTYENRLIFSDFTLKHKYLEYYEFKTKPKSRRLSPNNFKLYPVHRRIPNSVTNSDTNLNVGSKYQIFYKEELIPPIPIATGTFVGYDEDNNKIFKNFKVPNNHSIIITLKKSISPKRKIKNNFDIKYKNYNII